VIAAVNVNLLPPSSSRHRYRNPRALVGDVAHSAIDRSMVQ
jgi:hypothetical protein